MEDCVFCKIVSGDIPSSKVYEDDDVLAFLDITQATDGHTLVIPKKHVRNVLEMDEKTAETFFSRVPKLARAIQKAMDAQGLNIINNNEKVAGQTVFHAHIHLLPRYQEGDEFDFQFVQHEPDFVKLAKLAKTIQKEVVV
ncbi:HIT family protein [Streptococcus marimammalium]|uniref:HIT family protein n=1 Tax=Streptococcus marimammalium TaxID=269666 RepID=UPI00036998E2|nr:HIT family protein [Streptococcus marimammalium]